MRAHLYLVTLVLVLFPLHAQDTRQAFEAASVKVNTSGSGNSSTNGTPGQVVMTNQSLHRLIERAYDVQRFQIAGPSWLDDARYDIVAKNPAGAKGEDRAGMLRALIEDRFGLKVHRESREMSGYAMLVAKGGFRLQPVEPGRESDNSNGNNGLRTLTVRKGSIGSLASILARDLGQPVGDETAIRGVYDFVLRWSNLDGADGASDPSLFTALQQTLGLRLEGKKVPVEMIVVDHADRVPVEN